jgi:hypothetical protein
MTHDKEDFLYSNIDLLVLCGCKQLKHKKIVYNNSLKKAENWKNLNVHQ